MTEKGSDRVLPTSSKRSVLVTVIGVASLAASLVLIAGMVISKAWDPRSWHSDALWAPEDPVTNRRAIEAIAFAVARAVSYRRCMERHDSFDCCGAAHRRFRVVHAPELGASADIGRARGHDTAANRCFSALGVVETRTALLDGVARSARSVGSGSRRVDIAFAFGCS